MKYVFIHAHAGEWPVTVQCRVLQVSTSGYYAWKARPGASRPDNDDRMTAMIRQIFERHQGSYGSPRITDELRSLGHRVNRKRVERLMREMGLCGKQHRRRFKPITTVMDPQGPVFPDLIQRDFSASDTNLKWVGDITYLQTADGFEYLATVLDLFSRRIVGWALGSEITTELVTGALSMALANRRPEPGVVFHSDRGCQYTSAAFREYCQQHHVRQSMSRTGCCYDNAVARRASFIRSKWSGSMGVKSWIVRVSARPFSSTLNATTIKNGGIPPLAI